MIAASELTKRFGAFTAVDRISFEVEMGQVVGFIGPNGAGKTTTMRMLTGFIPSTDGRATVAGHDVFDEPVEGRRRIGYLPETPPLYPELTIGDYLRFIAQIREVPRTLQTRRVGEVMERVGLHGWENRILGSLSKGYRQRVGLAQAIIHDPKVNFEDIENCLGTKSINYPEINSSTNLDGLWSFSDDIKKTFQNSDALVIITEWPEYSKIDWGTVSKSMRKPGWIFDTRGIVNIKEVRRNGLKIWVVGNGEL